MSADKLYTLAQKTDVKELFEQYKEYEKSNLDEIKKLERRILLLKTENSMKKNKLIKAVKEKEEYKEFEEIVDNNAISFIDIIDKVEMMVKINYRDEIAREIVHELLAETVMEVSDVARRGEMLKVLLMKKNEINGEEINQRIYEMLQRDLKKNKK